MDEQGHATEAAAPYLVIARKYRPQTFGDVVGQEAVVRTLKNAIQSKRVSHAYLFAGSRGTGKTSIARLLAKALNCPSLSITCEPCNDCVSCREITEGRSLDVHEIDGASHRGIDHIRSLTESASYAPVQGRFKIFIIDEVHMLTKEAFNALLKTLEEPPSFVQFFLATTEAHKIPQTIVSRCQRFNLRRLSEASILTKLQRISKDMGIRVEESALRRLATYADGGLRDAESLLDQLIAFSDGPILESTVEDVLGIAPNQWFLELDQAIETADIGIAYAVADRVFFGGKDIDHFIDDLSDHYRSLLRLTIVEPKGKQPHGTTGSLSQEHILEILGLLAEAQRSLKTASSQRFLLEWLLISIVRVQRKIPLPTIVKKLFELQGSSCAHTSPPGDHATRPRPAPQPCLTVESPPRRREAPNTPLPTRTLDEKPSQSITEPASPTTSGRTAGSVQEPPRVLHKAQDRPEKIPLETLTREQMAARQDNLIQFAAVELGAMITTPKPT